MPWEKLQTGYILRKIKEKLLLLSHFHRSKRSLVGIYTINDLVYAQSVYFDFDLVSLEKKYGKAAIERIYAHIFSVYAISFYIFLPDKISLGPYVVM